MGIPEAIFKAYDIRGLYPAEFAEDAAERVGYALAQQLGAARVGVGRDPRPSSPGIADAFAAGAAAAGAAVVDFGMVATEMLYYGVADRRLDGGAMVTASHNPPTYNGMKLVGDGALPLSGEQGMPELMQRTLAVGELPEAAADGADRRGPLPRLRQAPARLRRRRRPASGEGRDGRGQRRGRQACPSGLRRRAAGPYRPVLRGRRELPEPRAEPAARGEPRRARGTRAGREGRPRDRLGRRRRPLLLHRRERRVRARRLRHGAARRGAARPASRRRHPLRPPRQPGGARHDHGRTGACPC